MPDSCGFKELDEIEKGDEKEQVDESSQPITNQELQLAYDFVKQTGCNIFLTGKAGTGKTTFLKSLHKKTGKNMVITAPTGVAAINAGGVTLHSFFQLPLGPYLPGSEFSQEGNRSQYKLSKEKQNIIKNLDLLVIDEISMVRADILDAVNAVLCRYRHNNQPFGGVQLLMIGDLHQLPPVAKREEWDLLRQVYQSVYFFSSRSLARSAFISIELKYIYRQTDEKFIAILNQLRENQLDELSLSELNKRYVKDYIPGNDQGYITLTTHNVSAESMNNFRLQGLEGGEHFLAAEIKGEFQKNSYPAPEKLRLKKGAQVMFLRNDNSPEKSYFNGKIGKITKITTEKIEIVCPDNPKTITVDPVIWENIRYSLNKETMKIQEEVIGTFKQFPLKLAWAITIHKSQGLTFEKAIIDSGAAFAHGQTYVALSRCKTLDGVVLSSPISSRGIEQDKAIRDFDQSLRENSLPDKYLREAKINFQQGLLLDCFDFVRMKSHFSQLVRLLLEHGKTVRLSGFEDIAQSMDRADLDIFDVSDKFQRQLRNIFLKGNLPESDPQIQERLNKASIWFQEKLKDIITDPMADFHFETDNSILEVKIKGIVKQLEKEIMIKRAGIKAVENGFSPSDYQHKIRQAQLGKTSWTDKVSSPEAEDDHSGLVTELKKWRLQKSTVERISRSHILNQEALFEIAKTLPDSTADLKRIPGVGKKTIQKRGKDILRIVERYRKKHGIKKGETNQTQ